MSDSGKEREANDTNEGSTNHEMLGQCGLDHQILLLRRLVFENSPISFEGLDGELVRHRTVPAQETSEHGEKYDEEEEWHLCLESSVHTLDHLQPLVALVVNQYQWAHDPHHRALKEHDGHPDWPKYLGRLLNRHVVQITFVIFN